MMPCSTHYVVGQRVTYGGIPWYLYAITLYTDRYMVEDNAQVWKVLYTLSNKPPGYVYDARDPIPEKWVTNVPADALEAL